MVDLEAKIEWACETDLPYERECWRSLFAHQKTPRPTNDAEEAIFHRVYPHLPCFDWEDWERDNPQLVQEYWLCWSALEIAEGRRDYYPDDGPYAELMPTRTNVEELVEKLRNQKAGK